jgi:hypothetical protein
MQPRYHGGDFCLTPLYHEVGLVEVDFSAQCSADKVIVRGENECTCCSDLKRELKVIQDELSLAKLIIKLLQTEGSTNEHAGYGTIERAGYGTIEQQNLRI